MLKLWLFLATLMTLLTSCSGYPRLLNFSYDVGGRGFNSPNSELMPGIGGNYIVFVSDRNGSEDIYLFDANRRLLLDLPGLNTLESRESEPSISEDGRYLAYLASRFGRTDLFLYDRQTNLSRNLTENIQAEIRHPHLSADGSRIAFEVDREGQWDILVVDRQGKLLN